jgi:dTDP-4-amino-4,6-dideoxygalactose transaminase
MIADNARSLRSHAMTSMTWDRHRGHAESYDVVDVGFNFRMDEPRAALGLSRLPRLDGDVAHRRELVRRYRERLAEVRGLTIPWTDEDVERGSHFGFAILLESEEVRGRVSRDLADRGIQTTHYPAIGSLSAYRDHAGQPRAEDLASRHLLLPLSSVFTDRQVDLVVGHVTQVLAAHAAVAG